MEILAVPKPIFKKSREVAGYYLSFQLGNALLEEYKTYSLELSMDLPFFDLLNQVGLEVLTYNKMFFVPVTTVQLAMDLENNCNEDYSKIVLMLSKKIEITEANLERVKRFKALGFKIAFYSFASISHIDAFLPHTDFVFCDHVNERMTPVTRFIRMKGYQIELIATNVDSSKDFDVASFFGAELLEGQFYKLPADASSTQMSPLQLNYIQLINQVSREEFDFGAFAKIIQRDTALAIQFLRMVNSSINNMSGNRIKSVRHAAAMLGQRELERWVTTAVTSMLSQDKPGELTRVSMIRAKFCENMAKHFEMALHSENLFLMGLMSVLDVILEMPMEEALELVLLPDKVRDALLSDKGEFAKVLQFIKLYEQGNWHEISRIALVGNITIKNIFGAYLDTLLWYGRMINMTVEEDELEQDDQ